jgi:hypothetical protein
MKTAAMRHHANRYRGILLLTLLCLGSRLLFLGPFLEDWDSVDFALALDSYNIKKYQPHFPGYPIYIFLSWVCDWLVRNPVTAVILPGALLGALTIVPVYALARRLFGPRIAMLSALLFLVNPACWLQAEKAFSDASGLFMVMSAGYLCWRTTELDAKPYHVFLGSMLLGLGLGVRLSYAPLLLSWAGLLLYLYWWPTPRSAPLSDACYGLMIGVCLWFAPQLALTGGLELWHDGLAFTAQHFSQWGGTLVSAAAPEHQQLGYRLTMFIWSLLAYSLGVWWVDTSAWRVLPSLVMLIAFALCCRRALGNKNTGFLLLYLLPYSLWIFFGQHADQPRHLLPLIPVLLVLLASGLDHLLRTSVRLGTFACALLLLVLGVISTRLVVVHWLVPPPRLQVLQYVTTHYEPASTRLYAWGTRRMFAFYAPAFDVRQRPDIAAAQQDLEVSRQRPSIFLATSDVQGVTASPHMQQVQLFERDRYVHNPHSQMGLYRWYPPGYQPLAAARGDDGERWMDRLRTQVDNASRVFNQEASSRAYTTLSDDDSDYYCITSSRARPNSKRTCHGRAVTRSAARDRGVARAPGGIGERFCCGARNGRQNLNRGLHPNHLHRF